MDGRGEMVQETWETFSSTDLLDHLAFERILAILRRVDVAYHAARTNLGKGTQSGQANHESRTAWQTIVNPAVASPRLATARLTSGSLSTSGGSGIQTHGPLRVAAFQELAHACI